MLFDDLFALNGFLGDECRSFLQSDLCSVSFALLSVLLLDIAKADSIFAFEPAPFVCKA